MYIILVRVLSVCSCTVCMFMYCLYVHVLSGNHGNRMASCKKKKKKKRESDKLFGCLLQNVSYVPFRIDVKLRAIIRITLFLIRAVSEGRFLHALMLLKTMFFILSSGLCKRYCFSDCYKNKTLQEVND